LRRAKKSPEVRGGERLFNIRERIEYPGKKATNSAYDEYRKKTKEGEEDIMGDRKRLSLGGKTGRR